MPKDTVDGRNPLCSTQRNHGSNHNQTIPSSALLPIFFGEGSPTKIDDLKEVGTLILTSPLEDLVRVICPHRARDKLAGQQNSTGFRLVSLYIRTKKGGCHFEQHPFMLV